MGKLAYLRKGITNNKTVVFPGTEEKVAIVALKTKDIIASREEAMKHIQEHTVDIDTGDLILNMCTLFRAMRNPDNLEEYFADSFEEIEENTEPKDIYELHKTFLEVQNGETPNMEDITQEEFEELKKKLNQIQLKDLDGELRTILKYCHQMMITKDLQMDK